jgi:hypothetical protein
MIALLAICAALAAFPVDGPVANGPLTAVTDSAIYLWARTPNQTEVWAEYREHDDLNPPPWSATEVITPTSGNAWRSRWTISGLLPATEYDLRICAVVGAPVCSSNIVTVGTAPDPAEIVDGVRLAFFADAASTTTTQVWGSAAALDPDYAFVIGDWDHRDPNGVLNDYRTMHKDTAWDTTPGAQFATSIALGGVPLARVWDDHDYGGQNFDESFAGKSVARRAYEEFFPHAPFHEGETGAIYHTVRWGQVEVWMLDSRWYRGPIGPACGDGATMLGPEQRMWLLNGLMASDATWKVIVSPSVWNPTVGKEDSWYSYPDEQGEILALVEQADITGVVIVSGDIHGKGFLDDGTNSGLPELNVGTINISPIGGGCTNNGSSNGPCGTWSVPWSTGEQHPGFGLVEARWDAVDGHTLVLSNYRFDGVLKRSLECTPAGDCL